jgi:steroid 5-alpha reductase family enzyme
MKRFLLFLAAATAVTFLVMMIPSGGPLGLITFITLADPLLVVCFWTLGFALTSFAFGLVTSDYSWVDRLWSTLPVAFAWFYAWRGLFQRPFVLAAVAVTVWGGRLTYNFARRGGYTGMEDYRWPILKAKIGNPVFWQLFNFGFISHYQTALFVLFTLPLYGMVSARVNDGNPLFTGALFLMMLAVLFETLADQQQWNFQNAKAAFRAGQPVDEKYRADAARGFRTTGLFSVSRHPNYFGELSVWWFFWLAGSIYTGSWLNLTLTGPVLLTLLFVGSTIFTEGITAPKYPEYKAYRKRVSPIIPWFPGKVRID